MNTKNTIHIESFEASKKVESNLRTLFPKAQLPTCPTPDVFAPLGTLNNSFTVSDVFENANEKSFNVSMYTPTIASKVWSSTYSRIDNHKGVVKHNPALIAQVKNWLNAEIAMVALKSHQLAAAEYTLRTIGLTNLIPLINASSLVIDLCEDAKDSFHIILRSNPNAMQSIEEHVGETGVTDKYDIMYYK